MSEHKNSLFRIKHILIMLLGLLLIFYIYTASSFETSVPTNTSILKKII